MQEETFEFSNRVVSVLYPQNLQEYTDAIASGYQVATTPEQRKAWGLRPFADLPVLSPDEAIALLFANPVGPGSEEHDQELLDNPDNYDDDGKYVGEPSPDECRIDMALTVSRGHRGGAADGDEA